MESHSNRAFLVGISLSFVIGGIIFAAMGVGREYCILEIPYGPYLLIVIAVVIVILDILIVLSGMERGEEKGMEEPGFPRYTRR